MGPDLSSPVTQARFGELVGVSQQAVSELARRKIILDGASAGEWLLAYCGHLREMAAGRGGDGGADLVTERARLAREQADKIAMQNAVTRGELAPAYVLEEVLSRAGARAARLLETIPGTLRRRVPLLTSDDITVITSIVAKARNMAAAMKLADVDADDDAATDDALPVDHKDEAA